jgi:Na+/phosphate symporter
MSVQVKNNPAGRLCDLLNAAKKHTPTTNIRTVWASVFGIDEKDTATLLKSVADLIDLVNETKASLSRLTDVDTALYLQPFANIERGLAVMNFDNHWNDIGQHITETVLAQLAFGADKLARVSGFTEIDQSELDELREAVEKLLNDVLAAELPENLTQLLVRNLEAIRQALLGYRLRGVQGLEQEIERSVGSMVLHQDQIKKTKAGTKEQTTWETYFTVITRLNAMVTAAKNIKEIGPPAIQYLVEKLTSGI